MPHAKVRVAKPESNSPAAGVRIVENGRGGAETRMDQRNLDLGTGEMDHLFATYRTAVPDPEASVNFMPDLWRKIETRQFFLSRVKKLTQIFVAAAAAICLLLGIALQVPVSTDTSVVRGNYVDVLADANPAENLTAVGIRVDYTEPNAR